VAGPCWQTRLSELDMALIDSKRRFQMWSYIVSHGQLLLRSTKGDGHDTRVDVLFKNVVHINLPTLLTGLRVTEADPATRNRVLASVTGRSALPETETHVFLVQDANTSGVVVAGFVGLAEDSGEYSDPSPLLSGY
jgi:hypothetical protein